MKKFFVNIPGASLYSTIVLLGVMTATAPARGASIIALGDLPGGSFNSQAYAISDDGLVAVGSGWSAASPSGEPMRWTRTTGMEPLTGVPQVFDSQARGVSANGDVIVGKLESATARDAFRWTENLGLETLGYLSASEFKSFARDVSADGSIIVGGSASDRIGGLTETFRWSRQGGMQPLFVLPVGSSNEASSVSANGEVVVGVIRDGATSEAFRWLAANVPFRLGDLPGGSFFSAAFAVSADGGIVVGQSISQLGPEAFRWTESGGMQGLGDLPGGSFYSAAQDVSADGSVVVGFGRSDNYSPGQDEAFIWDANNGMRRLETVLAEQGVDIANAGFVRLFSAEAVSANGQFIAGVGESNLGATEAYLVNLGPEPETCFIDLSLSMDDTALILDLGLRLLEPGDLNLFLNAFDKNYPLFASPFALPVTDPPQFFRLTLPGIPDLGQIGILATVTTGRDGIRCSNWKTVESNPAR